MQTSSRLCAGFERKRVKLCAHSALERGIDHLMLRHPRFSRKRRGANNGLVVVAVAGQVLDFNVRIGKSRPQESFELGCAHSHGSSFLKKVGEGGPLGVYAEQMTITKVLVALGGPPRSLGRVWGRRVGRKDRPLRGRR